MATNETFNDMLKVYMPYELLTSETKARNYFWNKVSKDQNWYGGTLDVPFEGAEASSMSFGALVSSSDIAESDPVLGTVSTQPEFWGAMKFNEKDLDRHNGDMKASFLEIYPSKVKQFSTRMAERVSMMLLAGYLAKVTDATDAGSGILVLDRPQYFTLGEKVEIKDDNTGAASYYVTAINKATKAVTFSATRGGGAANLAAYSVDQNAKIYPVSGSSAGFSSLRVSLLSAANGGSSTLYGQTKTAYPFLQAQQHNGSAVTAANILEKVYDAYWDTMDMGKGSPSEVLMSFKHFKNCCKALELNRDYAGGDKSGGYGFSSLTLTGNEGTMKITGMRDMPDSELFILDWDAFKFHGNNFFERKRHFNGDEFFLERATTGYTYIVDIKFFGDLILNHPEHCGIMYGLSY